MSFSEKRALLAEINPDILLADGLEEGLVGFVEVFSRVIACYDRSECIDLLMKQGMTSEEAEEYFSFNVVGAYAGENTPAFLSLFPRVGSLDGAKGTPCQCLRETWDLFQRIHMMPMHVMKRMTDLGVNLDSLEDPMTRWAYELYNELLKAAEMASDWLRAHEDAT